MVRSRGELAAKWLSASESSGWVQNLRAKECEGSRTLVVNRVKRALRSVRGLVILADRGGLLGGSSACIDGGVVGAVVVCTRAVADGVVGVTRSMGGRWSRSRPTRTSCSRMGGEVGGAARRASESLVVSMGCSLDERLARGHWRGIGSGEAVRSRRSAAAGCGACGERNRRLARSACSASRARRSSQHATRSGSARGESSPGADDSFTSPENELAW